MTGTELLTLALIVGGLAVVLVAAKKRADKKREEMDKIADEREQNPPEADEDLPRR